MSKRIFTQEQITMLLGNKHVAGCSDKSISYRKDFKIAAVKRYQEGLPPSAIFREAGFNLALVGRKIPKDCLRRWLAIWQSKGDAGLIKDARSTNNPRGRPKHDNLANLNEKDKLKYYEAQIAYLKAENAFLAKLRKQR